MDKYDIKKKYSQLYRATTKKISRLMVPKMKYIAVDGVGNPTVAEFKLKSELMFSLNKILKEYYLMENIQFSGAKLEGIWDTYDNSHFDVTRKKMIKYTLLMPQPDILTHEMLEEAKAKLFSKTESFFSLDIYLKEFEEGECLQMLHIGPYNTEINSTKKLMEYITVANLKLSGFHHEIYLNNPKNLEQFAMEIARDAAREGARENPHDALRRGDAEYPFSRFGGEAAGGSGPVEVRRVVFHPTPYPARGTAAAAEAPGHPLSPRGRLFQYLLQRLFAF